MRRLDWLVRNNNGANLNLVFETLTRLAPKVSNKVLYENRTYFATRLKPNNDRSVMVKGSRKRTPLPTLPILSKSIVDSIQETILSALKYKFSLLPKMGKVYLDEELKKIPLPSNMRSASSGLKPIIRGTRTPIGNQSANTIRAFVHWFDENGYEDLDLTATYIGMGQKKLIGWNGDKNTKEGCYSGDVRCRVGACAEYIDINVNEALKSGFKYVILDVRNYQGRGLDTMKDCVAGFMEREFPKANEIFVPATLANSTRLMSASTNTIINVIDLETRESIHLDLDQDGIPVASANFQAIMEAIKPYCEPPVFSVYHLLEMHVNARGGTIVPATEKADTYFNFADFSESYVQTLQFMGI